MSNQASFNHYKSTHFETATPEKILLMLYDGAIRFLTIAANAMGDQQMETAHNNLLKGEAIIIELMSVLDMEVGGEIARNLFSLYDFMYHHLVKANLQRDPSPVREVIELLTDLRKTWAEAIVIAAEKVKERDAGGESFGAISFAG